MAFRNTIPDFQLANPLYIGAQVSFFTVDQNGVRTTTLATLYANPTGAQQTANPQDLDSEGKFQAPVYIEVPVIAEAAGPNVESHTTGVINARGTWRGDWATATVYFSTDFVRDPVSGNTYAATNDYLSGASVTVDVAAGNLLPIIDQDDVNTSGASLAIKVPVRVASTANITLSGLQTIDGVTLVAGDRILVKNQSTASQNGIYDVSTGNWTRARDFDGANDAVTGTMVRVVSGSVNTGVWEVTTTGTITIGTSSIAFGLANNVLAGVSAFMSTVLDDTTALAARTTLGFPLINVVDYGATGDGVTNDTTAITNAINAVGSGGGEVYFPAGNYLIDPTVFNGKNYCTFRGVNKLASVILLRATGTLLTFQNCQWLRFAQLTFQSSGIAQAIANGYGPQLDNGSGNCTFEDCNFVGFSKDGLRMVGTVGTPLSGMKVSNCYFLGNGGNQLYSYYTNDFHYENNQFGRLAGITKPSIGCLLDHSSTGTYKGNYHWSNGIGFKADTCNYNVYVANRVEQSDHENVYFTGGSFNIFNANRCHSGSQTSNGTYDNIYCTNLTDTQFTSNNLFTLDATYTRWGMNFDTGCLRISLGKNKVSIPSFDSTNFGPYRVESSVVAAAGLSGDVELYCASQGTIAAGATFFVGIGQSATEAAILFRQQRRMAVLFFSGFSDTAPGAGKTFTYTLRIGGADSAMTAQMTGAATFQASAPTTSPQIRLAAEGTVSMKTVIGAAAGVGNHTAYIALAEY